MARPTLFHVNLYPHARGSTIAPGRYGFAARRPSHADPSIKPDELGALLWEATLETARRAINPSAPSRLQCVFAFESLDLALLFRNRFRRKAGIYVVEPWQEACQFRGDFGLLTDIASAAPFLDFMPTAAIRYWTGPPGEHVEIIIGAPVTVLERIK